MRFLSLQAVRLPIATLALLALPACRSESPVALEPGIRILADGATDDTVLALAGVIDLEVRDQAGQPAVGATVQLAGRPVEGDRDPSHLSMYACMETRGPCAVFQGSQGGGMPVYATLTNADGRVRARVQHGTGAGVGTIDVYVPELHYSTSVTYQTRVGSLARIAVEATDTAVYRDASFSLHASAADQFLNRRPEAVTVVSNSPSIATVANGVVTGVDYGRASIGLRVDSVQLTTMVTVVPRGRLLLAGVNTPPIRLTLVNTDGSDRRIIGSTLGAYGWASSGWSADGSHIVLRESGWAKQPTLVIADTLTTARIPLVDTAAFSTSSTPSFSRSARLMSFWATRADGVSSIYTASLDGTVVQPVVNGYASMLSPDGTVLAYGWNGSIRARNLATSAESVIAPGQLWSPSGRVSFWSPRGDLIALLVDDGSGTGANVHVLSPDGSADRVVATHVVDASSFSPDGEWIATITPNARVELVRVADGMRLPLPFTGPGFEWEVSWRP